MIVIQDDLAYLVNEAMPSWPEGLRALERQSLERPGRPRESDIVLTKGSHPLPSGPLYVICYPDHPEAQNDGLFSKGQYLGAEVLEAHGVEELKKLGGMIQLLHQARAQKARVTQKEKALRNFQRLGRTIEKNQERLARARLQQFIRKTARGFLEINESISTLESQKDVHALLTEKLAQWGLSLTFLSLSEAEKHQLYPLEISEFDFLVIAIELKGQGIDELSLAILKTALIGSLEIFYRRHSFLKKIEEQTRFWKDLFVQFPYPMAIFDEKNDLLHHNKGFLNLGISLRQAAAFTGQEEVRLKGRPYRLEVITYLFRHERRKLVLFLFEDQALMDQDTSQLGIMTSSVAHELNNPLAGILAGADYLGLFDWAPSEQVQVIEEIKNSAKRCKALVESFLGFCRVDFKHHQGPLKEAIDQALNLVRSRMVETNVKILINQDLSCQHRKVNTALMAMVLYLVCGELITAYSHHMLLTFSRSSGEHHIDIHVRAEGTELIFAMTPDFDFSQGLRRFNLLSSLLEIEGLGLQVEGRELRFSQKAQGMTDLSTN